ncbi:ADOP family duplicated permease [Gaopeijia maritima]|uniref:ADOP family duplicated permease n=1 Tax=Gaopeijia maritima TaxID=3119007 RepID=UPI0032524119
MIRRLFRIGSASRDGSGPEGRRLEELDDEIRSHLEMRIDDLVASGMPRDRAEEEALRRFGSLDEGRAAMARSARARDRRLRLGTRIDAARGDLRLAVRRLRRSPGFTAVSVVTLALGIGLITAMLAAVDQVVVRPLPYPAPERLVTLMSQPEEGAPFPWVSSANWVDWRDANRTLESTALYQSGSRPIVQLPGADAATDLQRVAASRVTRDYFEVLRPPFAAGRAVAPADIGSGDLQVVVSERFWRERLAAAALPTALRIGERTALVVGAVRQDAAWPADTELWLPEAIDPARVGARTNINWLAIARLRPDAGLDQARADLGGVAAGIRESDPGAIYSFGVGVEPFEGFMVGDARDRLLLLLGAVGLVLLAVCLNVAGLSAARTLRRSPEIAVRSALGAGRSRILAESLVEHAVLGFVGGSMGLLVAALALDRLQLRASELFPRAAELHLDPRALTAWLLVTLAAALAAGAVPAWNAVRATPGGSVRRARGGRTSLGRTGTLLVVGEVAAAVALLVGGTLLVRSFLSLTARDTGFDPSGVIVAEVILDRPTYQVDFRTLPGDAGSLARIDYWRRAVETVAAIPGVTAVGFANALPTYDGGTGFVDIDGREGPNQGAVYRAVGGDYFRALDIQLRAGRPFDATDGPGTERVTVVNRTMAELYWPGGGAVGGRVRARSMEQVGPAAPWLTVVGVVDDVREAGYDVDVRPQMYVLAAQVPQWMGAMQLAAEADGLAPEQLRTALVEALRGVDGSLPVTTERLDERVAGWVSERLFLTTVLTGFGALALLLSAIGVYGFLSFLVSTRVREYGIRAALGADRGTIVGEVIRRSLQIVSLGLLAGAASAWVGARALQSWLVGVQATDPAAWSLAVLVILTAGVTAALLPAARAARIDPVEALRADG